MDNVTHALVGIVYAKAVERKKARISASVFWTAILASNLPDADVFLTRFGVRSKFNYLLQHRGYTHTLLAAVPLALLTVLFIVGFKKVVGQTKSGRLRFQDFLRLTAVAVACVLLHLGLDFLNDYGVHIFSPFFNRWFYGDILFIVDPYVWLCLIPFAYFQLQNRFAKAFWALLGAAMLGVLWFGPYTACGSAGAASVWALVSCLVQKKASSDWALKVAAASLFGVISFSAACSHFAKSAVENALLAKSIAANTRQIVLTPAPANPLCWRVWVTEMNQDQTEYVSRLGVISLSPATTQAETCDPGINLPRSAQLTSPDLPSSASIFWKGNSILNRIVYDDLRQKSCQFRNFLKFARLPFVQSNKQLIIGDLRYDRSPDLGFAEMVLLPDPSEGCLENRVPWEPPFFRSVDTK